MNQLRYFNPWARPVTMRFFAEGGGTGGVGGAPGATAGALAAGAPAPASPAGAEPAGSFLSSICDDKGVLKDGWSGPFKEQIGDSKYFDNFKPGKNTIHDIVKSMTGLTKLAGRALIPAADAPDEEWGKVWEAAGGIPKTAEDYGLTLEEAKDAPFPEGFKELLEKTEYMQRLANKLLAAKTPMRMAGSLASADLAGVLDRYTTAKKAEQQARTELLDPLLGKTPYEEAVKGGRAALARLCDHTDTTPSALFNGFVQLLEGAGLMNHPATVGMLHQIASRMNPGKVLVTGTRVTAVNPGTGPGVMPQTDYASAMGPLTLQQITGGR